MHVFSAFRNVSRVVHGVPSVRDTLSRPAMAVLLLTLGGCAAGQVPSPDKPETASEVAFPQAMRMAKSVRTSGDAAGAALFYRRAHMLAPEKPEPLIGLAEAAAASGAAEEAGALYHMALAIDPGNSAARLGYGRMMLLLGRIEVALPILREFVDSDAGDDRGYLALGIAYDLSGDPHEAQRVYRDGLLHTPDNPSLRNNLALSLAMSGNAGEAIDLLRELSREPGAAGRARQNLALAYVLDDRLPDAQAIAMQDLRGSQLQDALAFFQYLRELSGAQLAEAVMCRCRHAVAAAAAAAERSASQPTYASEHGDPATTVLPALSRVDAANPARRRTASLAVPNVVAVTGGSKTLVVADRLTTTSRTDPDPTTAPPPRSAKRHKGPPAEQSPVLASVTPSADEQAKGVRAMATDGSAVP